MASGATNITHGVLVESSPLSKSMDHTQRSEPYEDFEGDTTQQGSSAVGGGSSGELRRNNSTMSQSHTLTPSRGGTLKKRQSLKKKSSLRRSASGKQSRPGSIRSLDGEKEVYNGDYAELNNAFFTPVPTTGSPTEILADRFQGMSDVCPHRSRSADLTYHHGQLGERFSKT